MNIHQKMRKSPAVLPCAGELNLMLHKGMKHTEIASIYGTTSAAISKKLRRGGFAPTREYGGIRVTRQRETDVAAIMKRHPAPPTVKHADRVTRVTPTGMRITLKRVTFIDGPSLQD